MEILTTPEDMRSIPLPAGFEWSHVDGGAYIFRHIASGETGALSHVERCVMPREDWSDVLAYSAAKVAYKARCRGLVPLLADEPYLDDAAEEAALREAAEAVKTLVPESWRDPRMDAWQAQCVALELARRAEERT